MQRALLEDEDTNSNVSIIMSKNLIICEEDGITVNISQITTPNVVSKPDGSYAARLELALNNLYAYGSPVLIVVGTVGNTLAAVTLQSRLFSKTPSTRFILTVLALCEISLLVIPFLRLYLEIVYVILVRSFSSFGCKLHCFLTYVSLHLSGWTLVLLTLERTISVYFPFRCKQICSFRNVVCVWVTFFSVLVQSISTFSGASMSSHFTTTRLRVLQSVLGNGFSWDRGSGSTSVSTI